MAVDVTSFNATYPDYQPKPCFALREQQWQMQIAKKPDNWFCYVVQPANEAIVGFATGHSFHDPVLPYKGKLDKIHILKSYQVMSLGSMLMLKVVICF